MDGDRVQGDGAGTAGESEPRIELHWIPLGAGARVVRTSGKVFERFVAFRRRRPPCALYHSALVVAVPDGNIVIEMTPIPDRDGARRGVVAEGPVGTRWAGRFRWFRYEIRRWRDGVIPDVAYAASTVRIDVDLVTARRLLDLVASVPTPVWGRDELRTGDMWNSNSVVSWLLQLADIDIARIAPPDGGRAPGWSAGLVVAARQVSVGDRISLRSDDHRETP